MKLKITRLLSLFVVMFTMFSFSAYAGSSYYSKVTAKAVGNGKVYVKYGSAEASPTFNSTEASASSGKQSSQSHKYFLYAQADEGNVFAGWYENEECTGISVSSAEAYEVTISAGSTNQNSPTTKSYFAKFVSAAAPTLTYAESRIYANISNGSFVNEVTASNINGEITYESSNENVATVAADGTVTPKKNGTCYIKAKFGEAEGFYVLTVIDDIAAGVTQIGNGDFEDWRGVTSSNHAPNNWNSFETAEGTYVGFVKAQQVAMVEGGRPGSNGLYCVDIYSRDVSLAIAQGNLTVGCINAGAMTAAAAGNHNFSKVTDDKKSETISQIPSALKAWVKFVPGATNASYPNARVSATVHDAYNYITYGQASDDTDENKAHAIAQAEQNFSACDWTELTIPFEKTGNTTDGQMYIIVNFSTNAVPGKGQEGDHLYIDDVELVYPDGPEPVIYNKHIVVSVSGNKLDPESAPIEVVYNDDNTIDFSLNNFCLLGGGVGNINLPSLAMDENGNFSFDGTIQITEGDKEGVDSWIGPSLGDIPVVLAGTIKDDYFYVHIDINVGYPVEVEVGDLANATVSVSDALISTFCAPFTVAIPADYQSVVTASTVTGVEGNVLKLEPVADYVIPANTPVIVEIPMAYTLPVSGIYVKGTPAAGLLTGVYESTLAPVGSYVLQNLSGKVGFYQVTAGNQPTVGANRCYLTVASGIKAFYFDEDDATSIQTIENGQQTADGVIYNVAGQRMNKMQRGINIINGKKILK